jgi:hypothetical protein
MWVVREPSNSAAEAETSTSKVPIEQALPPARNVCCFFFKEETWSWGSGIDIDIDIDIIFSILPQSPQESRKGNWLVTRDFICHIGISAEKMTYSIRMKQ